MADDLACIVDAAWKGALVGRGIMQGEVGGEDVASRVIQEAGHVKVVGVVIPDDLARVIDAICKGGTSGRGIIDGGKRATAEQKAVDAAGVSVLSDDLARVVDAKWLGVEGQGNVKGVIGIDWHDTGSSALHMLRCRQRWLL